MAHMMGDPMMTGMGVVVPSFNGMGFYEQSMPRLLFKLPRVVPDQKGKFENDELFKKLSRESEVKYTSHQDRPLDERQSHFMTGCRRGHTEIAFVITGTSLQLTFSSDQQECNFDKEPGKVHIKSHLIMNGVCVLWQGSININTLDGIGCLQFDEERASAEATKMPHGTPAVAPGLHATSAHQLNYQHHYHQQHHRVPS